MIPCIKGSEVFGPSWSWSVFWQEIEWNGTGHGRPGYHRYVGRDDDAIRRAGGWMHAVEEGRRWMVTLYVVVVDQCSV